MAKRRPDALPDSDRCTRSGKSNWRCSLPRLPSKRFCHKHHLANLSRHHKPPQTQSIRTPQSQIWAFHRTPSAHHYALINHTTPSLADVTPLLPHPSNPSPSLGLFSPSPRSLSVPISDFAHRVFYEMSQRDCYRIWPRKGEVWRLVGVGAVEVVASFCETKGEVTVAVMEEGEDGGFRRRRHDGCELFRRFGREEMGVFERRVPDARVVHIGVILVGCLSDTTKHEHDQFLACRSVFRSVYAMVYELRCMGTYRLRHMMNTTTLTRHML